MIARLRWIVRLSRRRRLRAGFNREIERHVNHERARWEQRRQERRVILDEWLNQPHSILDLRIAAPLYAWVDGPVPDIPRDDPLAFTELIGLTPY